MVRRVSMLTLAVAVFAAAGGCRHRCGGGWFTSNSRDDAPCKLASGSGCFEGPAVPMGGAFPHGAPGTVLPGGGSPFELPAPQPGELIPRQGLPQFADPKAAPGDGGASVLPVPKNGVPVGR